MVTRIIAEEAARPRVNKARRPEAETAAAVCEAPVGERMSRVDHAWLRMDSPSNLMVIVGVWLIKPGVRYQAVCQRIEERLLRFPRFRQRVLQDASGATWLTDPDFKIERHVLREKLTPTAPGQAQQALQARLAEFAVQPLDMEHPLWQFRLVEHYQGGSALMVRIHHCIADGIALTAVTQSVMDGCAVVPPQALHQTCSDGVEDWLAENLIKPLTEAAVATLSAAGDGAVSALAMVSEPQKGLEKGVAGALDLAGLALHGLRDGAALALMPDDSPTRLKGIPGASKRVAWCAPLPLAEVKAVGKALNCSINDVLLSCVAGAIGQYLKSFGDVIVGKEIRAMVPVNLRPPDAPCTLGNQFGLAPLVLPIGLDNPVERLYEVRRRMRELKGSLQPLMTFGLLAVAGSMVKPVQDTLLGLFSRKTTAVMTNVPGPRQKLTLCGATIEQSLFWVPQSGTVGLGVSILSYGGGVQFGVMSDATLCPEPQKIIDEFEPEFAKLTLLTLMLPWPECACG